MSQSSWFEQRLFKPDWAPVPADVARCIESLRDRGFDLGVALAGVESVAPREAGDDEEPEVIVVPSEGELVPIGEVVGVKPEVSDGRRRNRFEGLLGGGRG